HMTALPVLARDVLAAGAEGLGMLNGASQVGGTLAGALPSALPAPGPREAGTWGDLPLFGAAPPAPASALLPGLAPAPMEADVAAAVMRLIGACAGAFDAVQQTLIQLAVPEEQRGRAVGVWVLGLGSAPIGHVEMGTMAAAVGAPTALAINGLLVLASAAALL